MEGFKRTPAKEKVISDIDTNDSKVTFIGEVLERSPGRMVVGDEGSQIEVIYDGIDVPGDKIVRVTGLVRTPLHISADVIQGMSGMNIDLYQRAKKLFK